MGCTLWPNFWSGAKVSDELFNGCRHTHDNVPCSHVVRCCEGGVFTNHNEAFNEAMRFHDDRDLLVKALGL